MADQIPYTVKFPDGKVIQFNGPSDMSDDDAKARAKQERALQEGSIASTYKAGRNRSLRDTASGVVSGIGQSVNPVNILSGMGAMAQSLVNPAVAAQTGQGMVEEGRNVLAGDPQAGGRAIGGLATALIAPKVGPFVGNRLADMAEAAQGTGRTLSRIPAKGAAGIVTKGTGALLEKVPTPMARGYERFMPNSPASPSGFADAAAPIPSLVDRYMPNSPATAGGFGASASDVPTVPQAVWARTSDGAYVLQGVNGEKLVPGQTVNVVTRRGIMQMIKVPESETMTGDRTTGSFTEGPGGLSSITPQNYPRKS